MATSLAASLAQAPCLAPAKQAARGPPRRSGAVAPSRRASYRVPTRIAVRGFTDGEEERFDYTTIRDFTNPSYVEEVLAAFPDQGIANVEEARVLYTHGGYTYLDVRSEAEYDDGKVLKSVHVPLIRAKSRWNSETQKKEFVQSANPDFLKMVEKKLPKKDTKILVGCSDGRARAIQALIALDEAGYTNLVGLKGGYMAWSKVFDNKLNRRREDGYTETYTHDGDSCGIHSSGAGFDRVDAIEKLPLRDSTEWIEWAEAVGAAA